MKKLKNKFILSVICIIGIIIFSQVYIAYSHSNVDTNSYFTLIKWKGTLNEVFVSIEEKTSLQSGDKIRVIGDDSLGVVEWWDGSLTRLWANTKISIDQNEISRDYSTINISFQLIAGKTWSNIVSFIGKDSSFTQSFEGVEAWVRGTIFEVDLENDYINVSDHQITIEDRSGNLRALWENEPLSISQLSLIELEEFLKNIQDNAWVSINQKFDAEYIEVLKMRLETSFQQTNPFTYVLPHISQKHKLLTVLKESTDYNEVSEVINTIPKSKYPSLYKSVLSEYQSLNFVSASSYDFYKRKLFYKNALITLSSGKDTEALVQSSVYDVQDILQSGNVEALSDTLTFLSEYKNVIPEVDIWFLVTDIQELPQELREKFSGSFESFNTIFEINIPQVPSISISGIEQTVSGTIGSAINGMNAVEDEVQDFISDKASDVFERFAR